MLTNDIARLRDWARLIEEYGPDISLWGGRVYVVGEMHAMADRLAVLNTRLGSMVELADAAVSNTAVERHPGSNPGGPTNCVLGLDYDCECKKQEAWWNGT